MLLWLYIMTPATIKFKRASTAQRLNPTAAHLGTDVFLLSFQWIDDWLYNNPQPLSLLIQYCQYSVLSVVRSFTSPNRFTFATVLQLRFYLPQWLAASIANQLGWPELTLARKWKSEGLDTCSALLASLVRRPFSNAWHRQPAFGCRIMCVRNQGQGDYNSCLICLRPCKSFSTGRIACMCRGAVPVLSFCSMAEPANRFNIAPG